LKKQIAVALVASLLIGSVPGWAEQTAAAEPAAGAEAQHQLFRDSVERAIDRAVESEPAQATPAVVPDQPKAAGPQLTANERRDLDTRRAALKTDPVARGTGGIILLLLGIGLTVGATIWAINKSKDDSTTTTPTTGMARNTIAGMARR
jgi:hypothetical protein